MRGLQVFQLLKAKIGEREAGALVTYIDTTFKDNRMELIEVMQKTFVTKEDLVGVRGELKADIAGLRTEMSGLRGELKADIAGLRGELKEDIAGLRGNLEVKISDVRTDVMRWMFALFVTMLLAILGLYFKK
jgi:hypothetical protein